MLQEKKVNTITVAHPEKKCIYNYRFRTEVIDCTNSNDPFTSLFIRKVTVAYIGKKEDQYKYQLLCFETGFEGIPLEAFRILQYSSAVFNQLHITVNALGTITQIDNLNSIRLKWEQTKLSFLKEYQGNAVLDYFHTMDDLLKHQKSAVKFLNHEKMYGLLFQGLGEYTKGEADYESITTENEIQTQRIATIQQKEKIQLEVSRITDKKEYKGFFNYHTMELKNAEAEEKTKNRSISKYSIVCLGLAERNTL